MKPAVVLFLASQLAACTSDFVPANSPRVATVMDGGQITYVRDGKKFPLGAFGGGLVEAVSGVPRAEEAARTYRGRMIGGLASYIAGLACGLIGVGAAASRTGRSSETVLLPTMACFLGGMGAGAGLIISAQPYQFDAVNLYNASIDERPLVPPPVYPYPYPAPPFMAPPGSGVPPGFSPPPPR